MDRLLRIGMDEFFHRKAVALDVLLQLHLRQILKIYTLQFLEESSNAFLTRFSSFLFVIMRTVSLKPAAELSFFVQIIIMLCFLAAG